MEAESSLPVVTVEFKLDGKARHLVNSYLGFELLLVDLSGTLAHRCWNKWNWDTSVCR